MKKFFVQIVFILFPLVGAAQVLKYDSPDNSVYKSYERTSQYVMLSDSTRLAVDVYLPQKGLQRENFPVIFIQTPYGRAYIAPELNVPMRMLTWITGLGWRPLLDQQRYSASVKKLLRHGYVVVVADLRGTGASFGKQMPLDPQHGKDGKEMIDWIADQPFCNGNVGMMGQSYLGWAQFATAAQHPQALKCIAPEVIFMESFTSSYKPGGIEASRWMNTFSDRLYNITMNYSDMSNFNFPVAPVVDEDQDGRLDDEWPIIDSTIYSADTRPVYRDHDRRTDHLYWKATREHVGNIQVKDLMGDDFPFFDSETLHPDFAGHTFRDVAPGYYLEAVQESGIPVLHIGRWFDGFSRSTMQLFASSQHLNNHYLFFTPGFHMSGMSRKQRKFFAIDNNPEQLIAHQHLRFFDHYLKGIDNGWERDDRVVMHTVNNGWITANAWPMPQSVATPHYLISGDLQTDMPSAGIDTLRVDTLHDSSYGKKNLNRWTMATGAPNEPMTRNQADQHAAVYESPVLEEEVMMIGHPIAEFWISSNCTDTDVFVYLEEVTQGGTAYYVSEGQLRASWHQESNMEDQLGVSYTVKPHLPWHGYVEQFYDPEPFTDSAPILMRFDLMPVGWKFRKGSKIRIAIAGLDRSNFEINLAYHNKAGKLRGDVEIYLHTGRDLPSRIMLPIFHDTDFDSK